MKKILVLLLSAQMFIGLNAQNLTFELPIYFEDARGNKDTIIIGYGPDIDNDSVYTEQGETMLPWDIEYEKDLEVWFTSNFYGIVEISDLTKVRYRQFSGGCSDTLLEVMTGVFQIFCRYPPLRISWDQDLICEGSASECTHGTILVDNKLFVVVHDPNDYAMYDLARAMCYDSEMVLELGGPVRPDGIPYLGYHELEREDGRIDTIYGVEIIISNYLSRYLTSSSPLVTQQNTVNIYPQPNDGTFFIERDISDQVIELLLLDGNGKVIDQEIMQNGERLKSLDISRQPSGVYLLLSKDADGFFQTYKVIKQ